MTNIIQKEQYVLGISAYFHDSAAALVSGNKIIAAAQEERFTRKKADWDFPRNSIEYCLSKLPKDIKLGALAFYENPMLKMDRILKNAVSHAPRGTGIWPKTLETLNTLNKTLPGKLLQLMPDPQKIFFTSHHRSHAASAFYPSPFEEAAILVVDGVGEWSTTSIWHGKNDKISLQHEIHFPHSLGLLYSAFTQYCGFHVNTGEYKLMGLAPFGKPLFKNRIYEHLIEVDSEGNFTLNLDYFNFEVGNSTISPLLFHRLFGYPPRQPDEPISIHYMNVAASIQSVLNDIMLILARVALNKTGSHNLCLAGGVALNCVTNSEIARCTQELKNIWIQPAAGDAGGALGAALDIGHQLQKTELRRKDKKQDCMAFAYLGPDYNPDQILKVLQEHQLVYEDYSDDDNTFKEEVSQALQAGNIIGYFDGRMEFGPRALGNRSILADPRPSDMLQRANKKIKFRESWRPLAPVVLAEHEDKLFDSPVTDPYMLFVSQLKEQYHSKINLPQMRAQGLSELKQYMNRAPSEFPAITHYDYSARTQSLTSAANPRLHSILSLFYKNTGCPMLLNTSFNVRGEPIVCNPKDAISAFLNTHLDILAIGPYLVRKIAQNPAINKHIGKRTFRAD